MEKNSKIYVAGSETLVGAAIVRGTFWRGREVSAPAASDTSKQAAPPAQRPGTAADGSQAGAPKKE